MDQQDVVGRLKAAGYRPFNLSTDQWLVPGGSARVLSTTEALELLEAELEQVESRP